MKIAGANCSDCPLQSARFVAPESNLHAHFVVVTEQPTSDDIHDERLLSGSFGLCTKRALENAGLELSNAHVTAVVCCSKGKKLKGVAHRKAIECCSKRFNEEINAFARVPKLALGDDACSALAHRDIRPLNWFGYPIADNVFPLIDSQMALLDRRYLAVFNAMVRRFARLTKGDRLGVFPKMVVDFGQEARETLLKMRGKPLSIDVENVGDPQFAKMLCIGVSDGTFTVSIPWENAVNCTELLELLAADTIKIYHNAQHDTLALKAKGLVVGGTIFDTLVAHAALQPLLPHSLSFVAAILTDYPRWKTEFKDTGENKGSDLFEFSDPHRLRIYNAKDAFVTAKIYYVLKAALQADAHAKLVYDQELAKLAILATEMREVGVLLDPIARKEHWRSLLLEACRWQLKFSRRNLPCELGASGSHPSIKKYFFETLGYTPLRFSKETGLPKLDAWTLAQYRCQSGVGAEVANIVLNFRQATKLMQVYIIGSANKPCMFEPQADGRIHASWSPWRVPGGRWGCSQPNLMNIPKTKKKRNIRTMIIAPPGYVFVAADCDKAELRVIAHLAHDEPLMTAFGTGIDVHKANAKDLTPGFEKLSKEDQKKARDFAKPFVYGVNYGGSAKTMWQNLVIEYPKTSLLFVTELLLRWKKMHRAIFKWHDTWVAECFNQGYVEVPTGVGRRAKLFRGDDEERRFAINTPIQGVVASFVNDAALSLQRTLGDLGKLVIQCHDELVIECRNENALAVGKQLAAAMTKPHLVCSEMLTIPTEIKVGTNWGKLEPMKGL